MMNNMSRLLHEVHWTPASLDVSKHCVDKVIFVGADVSNNKHLPRYQEVLARERRQTAVVEEASCIGPFLGQDTIVVHLPRAAETEDDIYDAATSSCDSLIAIAQTLRNHSQHADQSSYTLFSLITRECGGGGLEYAPLHGLARVLKMEIPTVFGGLFEVDDDLFPLAAFQSARDHDYIKFLDGTPHTAALQPCQLRPADKAGKAEVEPELRSDASYLVTGGTSGMGLELAGWLAERGAGYIVLASRSGRLSKKTHLDANVLEQSVAAMESKGSTVHVLAIDFSEPGVERILTSELRRLNIPPVKGVIHAAGVAEYNTLDRYSKSDLARILAPKINGPLALSSMFPPGELAFFILISSFGHLVGFGGQLSYGPANAFLDELAAKRRQKGDACTSIQWTSWRGVGLMAQSHAATRMITKGMAVRGFGDISREEALQAFATIMSNFNLAQVAVVRALELDQHEPIRHSMLEHITPRTTAEKGASHPSIEYPQHAIAVVGMACRTAAGDTADDLWQAVSNGKTMEQNLNPERFPGMRKDESEMWGNFIQDVKSFDHQFFKKSKREAAALDPHQRLLLETTYHALESAGEFGSSHYQSPEEHDMSNGGRVTGCFIGMNAPDYPLNLACNKSSPYTGFGMLRSFVAGRLSHHFGWTGPSHVVDTACSSAMVAIHQACRAIQNGECNRAVAGGVNLITNTALYNALRTGGFLSDSGPCQTFDENANGYCRGEAVGVIVLKPLKDAIKDGDDVKGVLLATGNNQNMRNTSITNPVLASQTALYRNVIARAGIKAHDVSYVECHGTATKAGDPVEVQGIREVVGGKSRASTLYFGAVKPNIGHSEGASGVISLIKVLLMMEHRKVTPQANFKDLNPDIPALEFDNMAIPTQLQNWDNELRIAMVNNYGASGNNAAAIVGPPQPPQASELDTIPHAKAVPVFISASSKASLSQYCQRLKAMIQKRSPKYADLAFTLANKQNCSLPYVFATSITSSKHDSLRFAHFIQLSSAKSSTVNDIATKLDEVEQHTVYVQKPKPIVLLFSGQNGNAIFSAQPFYDKSHLFRKHLHRCDEAMRSIGQPSMFPAIIKSIGEDAGLVLRHAALFAIQYSSALAWIDSGVQPQSVCGHSFGEWAALAVCGILSLEHALHVITGNIGRVKLVARADIILGRAVLIHEKWGADTGSMLAIEDDFVGIGATPSQYLKPFRAKYEEAIVDIACYNGPNNYVVAGSTADIQLLESYLAEQKENCPKLKFKVLPGMHAFHSRFADTIVNGSAKLQSSICFQEPNLSFESCHSDIWTGPGTNVIARNTREPVYFAKAISRIVDRLGPCTFLEAGIGGPVVPMAQSAIMKNQNQHSFLSITPNDPMRSLAQSVASLWKDGQTSVQYWPFHKCQKSSFTTVKIPPYQFEKGNHWLEYRNPSQKTVDNSKQDYAPISSNVCPNCSAHTSHVPYISLDRSHRQDSSRAVYRINPKSDRFQDLVQGHIVAGTPICPAAMYLELAAHAVSLLPEVQKLYKMPEIASEKLEIKAPLGLDDSRIITLDLNCKAEGSWSFNLSSTKGKDKPLRHAKGVVSLQKKGQDDSVLKRDEQDIWNRASELRDDPDTEALRGSMVYKVFASMANYTAPYKGLKQLVSRGDEAMGEIKMPFSTMDAVARSPNDDIANPIIADNFLQVPGAFVQSLRTSFGDTDNASMSHICIGMDSVTPLNGLRKRRQYRAYAKVVQEDLKVITLDVFAFDEDTKKIVWTCRGLKFSKIPNKTLVKALSAANGTEANTASEWNASRKTNASRDARPGSQADSSVSTPGSRTSTDEPENAIPRTKDVLKGMQALLSRSLDIPAEDITDCATLDSLGVDSLVSSEILASIMERFKVEISTEDLANTVDVHALCGLISSRIGAGSQPSPRTRSRRKGTAKSSHLAKQSGPEVLAVIQEALSTSLDIPAGSISLDSRLDDLGVDSLVASEILATLTAKLGVEIATSDFAEVEDVESFCKLVATSVDGGSGSVETPSSDTSACDDVDAAPSHKESLERYEAVVEILSQSLDIPAKDIRSDSKLEDLGVDSLVAVEIIDRLSKKISREITTDELARADTVEDLYALFDGDTESASVSSSTRSIISSSINTTDPSSSHSSFSDIKIETPPTTKESCEPTLSMHEAFASIRQNLDRHAKETKLQGYFENVYQQQETVVTAFIVEAFEKLGCPIATTSHGERLSDLPKASDKYDREVPRLWEILEDAGIVEAIDDHYVRGGQPVPDKPAKQLSAELLEAFPAFESTHGLPDLLGPHLADALVGKANPVSLLFGSEKGRKYLGDFYANGPDLRACTEVLCDFFNAAIKKRGESTAPFRVLEIGAGTGGTTKHLIPLLQNAGIPFQYTFTELSGSLLAKAKNTLFKGTKNMDFRKLDIEKDPPGELLGKYHIVVSSNCVHATSNLPVSMANIRKLVHPQDGCVALVELTQKLPWYDLVWGLLDGWWLFNDGRKYALQSPWAWEKVMLESGFDHVDWSESASRESRAVRVICGMVGESKHGVAPKATSSLLHRGTAGSDRNAFLVPDGFGMGAVFGCLQTSLKSMDEVSVYCLNSPYLKGQYDTEKPPSIEELAGCYVAEIKRRQEDGPYVLGGYSFGGLVAYEAARQLLENGDEVGKLILIDTASPGTDDNVMPYSLVEFLDSIRKSDTDEDCNRPSVQPVDSDHFSLARKQLSSYTTKLLPGRKMPQVTLFSARSGVDKQNEVARPKVKPNEERITKWFLDDRDEGTLGWDNIFTDVNVVRIDGDHFSIMMAGQADSWGSELVKVLRS